MSDQYTSILIAGGAAAGVSVANILRRKNKTAAAVRKQLAVVVANIVNFLNKQTLVEGYDGYGSCPLATSMGTVMLAEFSYGGKVKLSFPFLDPRNNSRLWWLGKIVGFPWLYWKVMIKGYEFDIPHKASYAKKFIDRDS